MIKRAGNDFTFDAAKIIAALAVKRYASATVTASKYLKPLLISVAIVMLSFFVVVSLIISIPGLIMQSLLPWDSEKSMRLSVFAGGEINSAEQTKKNFISAVLDSLKVVIEHEDEETGETWTETFYASLVDPEPEKELVLIIYSVMCEGYFNGAAVDQGKIGEITGMFLEPTGWMGLDVKVKPFEQVVDELIKGAYITGYQAAIALNMYEIHLFGFLMADNAYYDDTYLDSTNIENLGSGELLMPLASYRVTSMFGIRLHPVTKQPQSMHNGIDLAANSGSLIYAADSGTVTFAGVSGTYGNLVIVDHGNGMATKYAHCSILLVKKGDKVAKGDAIARVGSTGRSTGPHLHFEVLVNGAPKNPMDYL